MSRRIYSFVLIVALLCILAVVLLFPSIEDVSHIGLYDFVTTTHFHFSQTYVPAIFALFFYSIIRLLYRLDWCYNRLVRQDVFAWFPAFVLGFLTMLPLNQLLAKLRSLHRSGVMPSTLVVVLLSTTLLSFPLIVFIWFLYGFFPMLYYLFVSLISIVFIAAVLQLCIQLRIVRRQIIVVRPNLDAQLTYSNIWFWRDISWKKFIHLWFISIQEIIQIALLPIILVLLFTGLLGAALSDDLMRLLFGNHLIGQLAILALTFCVPMYGISAFIFGYSLFVIHSGMGTVMTIPLATVFWKCILDSMYMKSFTMSLRFIWSIILLSVIIIAGYILNLYML